jgi:hypothetical protein
MKQEEIVLKVSYDEIDSIILDALSRSSYSVSQLTSIIRFSLGIDISYAKVVRKMEYLRFLGKIERRRKNVRIYEYFLSA